MKWYECALIGIVMAGLFAITLSASLQMRDAYLAIYDQYRLYSEENVTIFKMGAAPQMHGTVLPVFDKNIMIYPYILTGLVMAFAFALLFTIPLWYPWAVRGFDQLSDLVLNYQKEEDELE